MRAYKWLAAAALAAAYVAPAKAQIANGGRTSSPIVYNVINPSGNATSIAPPQTGQFQSSKLQGFFHWPSFMFATPVIGSSTFPAPGATPGLTYLQGFGFSVPTPHP
jgi:hypothetical protein